MKSKLLYISILLSVIVLAFSAFTTKKGINLSLYIVPLDTEMCYNVPNLNEIEKETAVVNSSYTLYLGKTYVGFKEALGFKESQGRYNVVNKFGYMGKYQFHKNTLSLIGIQNAENFLADTHLQEKAFTANASRNKWILRRDIKRYAGRWIGGVKVTESGILAAAHLAGAGNVKKFLRSGGAVTFNDAFGTSIKYYMKRFSGYDTSTIKPNKRAKVI